MDPTLIIKLLLLGASLVKEGIDFFEKSKATLSETDRAKIKAALTEAQEMTKNLRPIVDAALDEASKQQ